MGDFLVALDEPAIAALGRDPRGKIARALLPAAGNIVERGARRRVPVLTGTLYDSIGIEGGRDSHGLYEKVYAEWYDVFLEKPAKQMKRARRSLRTALRDIPRLL